MEHKDKKENEIEALCTRIKNLSESGLSDKDKLLLAQEILNIIQDASGEER